MRASPQRDRHAPESVPASGQSPEISPTRRRFLLGIGAGSAAAAAVAAPALAQVVPAAATPDATVAKGYQDTEHVRDYYASTRI
jgi:hypothetical protein